MFVILSQVIILISISRQKKVNGLVYREHKFIKEAFLEKVNLNSHYSFIVLSPSHKSGLRDLTRLYIFTFTKGKRGSINKDKKKTYSQCA